MEETSLPRPAPPQGVRFTASAGDLMEIGAMLFHEAEEKLSGVRKQRMRIRLGRRTVAEVPLKSGALGVLALTMLGVALTRMTVELE